MDFMVVSDESLNDQGFRVLTEGIITTHFEKNPIMLYVHERFAEGKAKFPVGKWEGLTKTSDGKLIAKPVFDDDDEDGVKLKSKYAKGMINMASIHGEIIEWSEDPALMLPGQIFPTVTKLLLREISMADLGSNLNCVRLSYKGKAIQLNADADNTEVLNSLFYSHKNDRSMKNVIAKLNSTKLGISLADNANEGDVILAVDKVLGKNAELSTQLAAKETEIETLNQEKNALTQKITDAENKAKDDNAIVLVEAALSAGKITAKQKDLYVKLAKSDYATTKEALDSMQAYKSASSQLSLSADAVDMNSLSEVDKVKKYDELFKSGKLASLKSSDYNAFALLHKAKYGKEPKQ